MRGVFTATASHSGLTAAKNVIILTAPADATVEILSASITNKSAETNEQLEMGVFRGSGGTIGTPTSLTEAPTEVGSGSADAVATHTWETADPTAGNALDLKGVASLSGYYYDPTPEERITVPPSGIVMLRIVSSTFTAMDVDAVLTWREIG